MKEKEIKELQYIPLQVFGKAREFDIIEIKSNPDKSWKWSLKIKFDEIFEEFFPSYNIHFIISPKKHQRVIDDCIEKLQSNQLSLEKTGDDFLKQIEDTKKAYQEYAESYGRHDFRDIRLKEYKADNADSTDIITFIVDGTFIEFFLQNARFMHDLAIVLNSSTDHGYTLEEASRKLLGKELDDTSKKILSK